MTSTTVEVMFSVGDISIKKDFALDGRSIVIGSWTTDGFGKFYYYAETMGEAKAALTAKISECETYLEQAKVEYDI